MKKSIIRLTLFYITLISYPLNTIIEPTYSSIKKIKKELTKSNILSDEDYALVSENPNADFAYIPEAIKLSIAKLHRTYKELAAFIDLSLFLDEKIHVADSELIKRLMLELIALLQVSDLSALDPEDTTLHLMQKYMNDLDAGNLHIKTAFLDEFGNIDIEIGDGKRSYDLFNTYNGYAVTTGGVLNIYGDSSNIITQGSGNTITVSLSEPAPWANNLPISVHSATAWYPQAQPVYYHPPQLSTMQFKLVTRVALYRQLDWQVMVKCFLAQLALLQNLAHLLQMLARSPLLPEQIVSILM